MLIFAATTMALLLGVYLLRRTRAANFILLSFTLSASLLACETYYRYFYCESDGFGRVERNFAQRYYKLDQFGLRESNLPVSESAPNLVILGDSHVFGAGLKKPRQRFSDLLARHYSQFHVLNIGFSGWDTVTESKKLSQYLGNTRARIPLVLLTYFFNDIEEDVTSADRLRLATSSPPQPTRVDQTFQWLSDHSRFVEVFYYHLGYPRLVRHRLDEIGRFYNDKMVLDRHLQTLENLRTLVETNYSAHLVIVVLPYLHSQQLLLSADVYAPFRNALAEHHFETVDMQPVFAQYAAKDLALHRFDPHTNPFANRLIAKSIVGYLDAQPSILSP